MGVVKFIIGVLLMALASHHVESTVANFLADRALSRMLTWVSRGGSAWLTMPGYKIQGLNSTQDGYYTLALAGPQFQRIDQIIRTEDARMGADVRAPPLNFYTQNLTLQLAVQNLTVIYKHITYTDSENGLRNATAGVTTDAIKVELTISITGDGSQCVASGADTVVSYGGGQEIISRDYDRSYYPEIEEAIKTNFDSNIRQAVEVFVYAAVVNIFDRYDICRDRSMGQRAFLQLRNLSLKELKLQKT